MDTYVYASTPCGIWTTTPMEDDSHSNPKRVHSPFPHSLWSSFKYTTFQGMVDQVTKLRWTTKGQEIEMVVQIMISKSIVVASASLWLDVRWEFFIPLREVYPTISTHFLCISRILVVFTNGFARSLTGWYSNTTLNIVFGVTYYLESHNVVSFHNEVLPGRALAEIY